MDFCDCFQEDEALTLVQPHTPGLRLHTAMTGDTNQVILGHIHDTHLPWIEFQDGDEDVNEKIVSEFIPPFQIIQSSILYLSIQGINVH